MEADEYGLLVSDPRPSGVAAPAAHVRRLEPMRGLAPLTTSRDPSVAPFFMKLASREVRTC